MLNRAQRNTSKKENGQRFCFLLVRVLGSFLFLHGIKLFLNGVNFHH